MNPIKKINNGWKTKTNESSKTNTSPAPPRKGIKTIAKALSVSKNTVKEYIHKAKASNLLIEVLLALEDPVLEGNYVPETLPIRTNVTISSNLSWIILVKNSRK